jgi:hypothetical protein
MGVGLNKSQLDELAASSYEIAELARKFRHDGDSLGELDWATGWAINGGCRPKEGGRSSGP